MSAAGPQDVGHVAVATGSGALKLHSFVTGAFAFGYSVSSFKITGFVGTYVEIACL